MKSAILGGTFSIMHKGHEALFRSALAFDEIKIGLTSDAYCKANKIYGAPNFKARQHNLILSIRALLKKYGKKKTRFEIMRIEDKFGFAPHSEAEAIIVSQDTQKNAESINKIRSFNLLKPLQIISIPLEYGDDYLKISSSRILEKKINKSGKRLKPVVFALGTKNPSKKQGLLVAAKKLFKKFTIRDLKVKSGISEQPFDEETVEGAINRAKLAYFATDADYGVGFESGIFHISEANLHDIAICAIFDGEKVTLGNSMGFQMPPNAIALLSKHKDLGAVMEEFSEIKKIGYKKGAIHYLSAGLLDRQQMNEQAFLCAMIPRISEAKRIFNYY